jgi:regulatory protein YycI of two-component signal transduction system YycFG
MKWSFVSHVSAKTLNTVTTAQELAVVMKLNSTNEASGYTDHSLKTSDLRSLAVEPNSAIEGMETTYYNARVKQGDASMSLFFSRLSV